MAVLINTSSGSYAPIGVVRLFDIAYTGSSSSTHIHTRTINIQGSVAQCGCILASSLIFWAFRSEGDGGGGGGYGFI